MTLVVVLGHEHPKGLDVLKFLKRADIPKRIQKNLQRDCEIDIHISDVNIDTTWDELGSLDRFERTTLLRLPLVQNAQACLPPVG